MRPASRNAVEYAFIPFLGSYASAALGGADWVVQFGEWLDRPNRWGIMRLLLFAAYLVVIAAGVARLREPTMSGSVARLREPTMSGEESRAQEIPMS